MNAQSTILEVCQAYALKQVGPAQHVSERVWRLPTNQGDVAIKIYLDGQRARATKEATLLAHLQVQDDPRCRVQVLRHSAAGDTRWEGPDTHAMVTRWEAGEFKRYDTFTPIEWAALGASLAALHQKLETPGVHAQETLKTRLLAIDIDDMRRALSSALDRGSRDTDGATLHAYVDTCLRMIDQYYPGSIASFPADDPQHPIHNDYNQFNYLFGATLPPLILDWEASIGAPREFELVRCLNHLPLESPELARIFVHAYLRVRPLRLEHMAWAVDAACLQHAIKLWVIQGWHDDPARFTTHLQGSMQMTSMMDGARDRLIHFFSLCLENRKPT